MSDVATGELLRADMMSATYTLWIEQDLTNGDGLPAKIAPEAIYYADDSLERVRFGKIIGYANDTAAVMPVVPRLLGSVERAVNEHPGGYIFLDEIKPDQSTEVLWQTFLRNQVRNIGLTALKILDAHVTDSTDTPATFSYLANLVSVEPGPPPKAEASEYDEFDVLAYLGVTASPMVRRALVNRLTDIYIDPNAGPSSVAKDIATKKRLYKLLAPALK